MYETYLKTLNNPKIFMVRFDVDSFVKKKATDDLDKLIKESTFSYQMELDSIKKIESFGKKNHYIKSPDLNLLNIPGLSLSYLKRNEISSEGLVNETRRLTDEKQGNIVYEN